MFKNYFTVAVRNLLRHKIYSAINVVGLAIGMACVLLIAVYVRHELTYDRQQERADRIFRVVRETKTGDSGRFFSAMTSGALVPAIRNDCPDVENATRILRGIMWIRYGDRVFEQLACMGDATILDIFTFPLYEGHCNPRPLFCAHHPGDGAQVFR